MADVNDMKDVANDGGYSIWETFYAAKNAMSKDAEQTVAKMASQHEDDIDHSDSSKEEEPMYVQDVPPETTNMTNPIDVDFLLVFFATAANFFPSSIKIQSDNVLHDPLDDATHQSIHAGILHTLYPY